MKPDGLFLASVLGGDSLFELRSACHAAEEERCGGMAPRTSPLMHVRQQPCFDMSRVRSSSFSAAACTTVDRFHYTKFKYNP
jgi:hypothetical protein